LLVRALLACALVIVLGEAAADAQSSESYPSRPVRLLVITPPGGTADVLARLIAGKLPDEIGGTFVVENRPGASGALASAAVAKSAPDGYTLLFSAINALSILPNLVKNLQYDPTKDLAPITLVSYSPNLLLANPSFPAKTVPEPAKTVPEPAKGPKIPVKVVPAPVAKEGPELGRYISDEQVLARYDAKEMVWKMIPTRDLIFAGERLQVLPTYRPQIALSSGALRR